MATEQIQRRNLVGENATNYVDIISYIKDQRIVHVMDWIGVCEIEAVDEDHISDAYHQMRSIFDAWEKGEISRVYNIDMCGLELCSDGSLDDGVYFSTEGKYILAVLNGQIISALYENDDTIIVRIGSHEYDYSNYE